MHDSTPAADVLVTPDMTAAEAIARRERHHADSEMRRRARLLLPACAPAAPRIDLAALPAASAPAPGRSRARAGRLQLAEPAEYLRHEWAEAATPPPANRGAGLTDGAEVKSLFDPATVRIHWLSGTFPICPPNSTEPGMPNVDHVRRLVENLCGPADDRLVGFRGYRTGCQWVDEKSGLFWTEGRGEALLDMTGTSLDFIAPEKQLQLLRDLQRIGFKATRIDPAFDDERRDASMDEIHAAAAAGHYTGFLKSTPIRERMRDGTLTGDTLNFGSRGKSGSGKFMRIYDKFLESDGLIDAIRYEAVFYKERADEAFQRLACCASVTDYATLIARMIGGAVTFLDRGQPGDVETHLDRCPLLPWWERILRRLLGALRIVPVDARATLAGAVESMKRQYGKTLAIARMVCTSMGVNFLSVVESWCEQLEPRIDWDKRKGRDLDLPLAQLLAT